jgi:threonine/homoserine/homoserine lactone efflux protein
VWTIRPTGRCSLSGLVAFVAISAAVVVTPGQDTLLTLRNTLAAGRSAGIMTALGVVAGQQTWALAATIGLAAAYTANPEVFVPIRIAGGVYLITLGAQSLRSASIPPEREATDQAGNIAARPHYVRQGLFSNLGNPKMLVFFASLMPQFVDPGRPLLYMLLGLTFSALTLAWLSVVAIAADHVGHAITGRYRRLVERWTGSALIALGIILIVSAAI